MSGFEPLHDPEEHGSDEIPDDFQNLGSDFAKTALALCGLIFPPATVTAIFVDQFSQSRRERRLLHFMELLLTRMKHLEQKLSERELIAEARRKAESEGFRQAVAVAGEEAIRATQPDKPDQFAAVLVGSLTPSMWSEPDEDVATMIRDIGQLGENDIRVLQLLKSAFSRILEGHPNLNVPSAFTENFDLLREALRESGIHTDDFYSSCARLLGFGLALEEVRSGPRMELYDRCFRPTRRGMALLAYLDTMGAGSNTTK